MDNIAEDYLRFDREVVAAAIAEDGGMPTEVAEVETIKADGRRFNKGHIEGRSAIPHKIFKAEDYNDDTLWNDRDFPTALKVYKKESPIHRVIAYLKAQGYSGVEIAEQVGLNRNTVYRILSLPWVKECILETIKEFGRDAVAETLSSSALDNIQFLVDIRNDDKVQTRDRITAAKELLDRTFGKPNQPITHREETDPSNLSDKQLAEIINKGGRGN